MNLQEIEKKCAALALDAAAPEGEWTNAAAKFFKLLRKRSVHVEELNGGSWTPPDNATSILRNEVARLNRTVSQLQKELRERPVRFVRPKGESKDDMGIQYTAMPFGKHEGKNFADVPSDYLRWVLESVTGWAGLKKCIKEYFEKKG